MAVVLYHANLAPFTGGYIGVDIFFVISGYLITGILLPDVRAGRLPLRHFYERRLRRIFPALFTVLAACFVAGWWLFLPGEFETFAKSAMASVFFVSNLFFLHQASGYFASSQEFSPLLHTWSLAVEEQIYIVFPAGLYLAIRFLKDRAWIAVVIVTIISFGVAVWATGSHPTGAFYRASLRSWEFLIGALLALGIVSAPGHRILREACATVGAILILFPIFTYTRETAFPGFTALPPCLGAALVIYAGIGGKSLIGRALSWKPVIGIGLISYSLYLWHWPVLVFCRQYFSTLDLAPLTRAGAITASLLLAWLSWRFIEKPARKTTRITPIAVFSLGGASTLLACAIAVLVLLNGGLPQRIPSDVAAIAAANGDYDPRRNTCADMDIEKAESGDFCRIGAAGPSEPSFFLWGDSHAGALLPAVDAAAKRSGLTGTMSGKDACPALLGIDVVTQALARDCRQVNDIAMAYIRATPSIDTVMLASRWAAYANGTSYSVEPTARYIIADNETGKPSLVENPKVFTRTFARTVKALEDAGKHVVIVGPVPEVGWNVPKWLATQTLTGHSDAARLAPRYADFIERQHIVLSDIDRLATAPDVTAVFPDQVLCDSESCDVAEAEKPLYTDDDHLSLAGAAKVSVIFDPVMQDIATHRPPAVAGR